MWWSRRLAFGALALLVAGCGFAPVYGPGGVVPQRGMFRLSLPETVVGFRMAERLEDRLGPPRHATYTLSVDPQAKAVPSLLTTGDETERVTLMGSARWQLLSGGAQIAQGEVRHFAPYSANDTTVAMEASREDAYGRLADGLADKVVTRVWVALK